MRFNTSLRKAYPSDLMDDQWNILELLMSPPRTDGLGRPWEVDLREVINAILYINRTGCQWDMLPHDLLPKSTVYGHKELVAISDGGHRRAALVGESEQSWRELLLDVKARGLSIDPKLATGDGALGFWKALPQVFPTTRTQRGWVHKTANVLDKLPKRL